MSTDKIAVVTGGSRGIGRNTVLSLAKRGVRSILTYNTNRAEAEKTAALAGEAGAGAVSLQLDVADAGSFDGFAVRLQDALAGAGVEHFDYLVNNALTRYMALELGPRRITANVVAPGPIATDFSGGMVRDNPAISKRIAEHTALGRPGLPEDVGPVIAALLSDEFGWVNAQRIEVAGGMQI
jgi:NAD(P)-dependent dehydrogenase (short-subunit alcohol dehydrogenase family)